MLADNSFCTFEGLGFELYISEDKRILADLSSQDLGLVTVLVPAVTGFLAIFEIATYFWLQHSMKKRKEKDFGLEELWKERAEQ